MAFLLGCWITGLATNLVAEPVAANRPPASASRPNAPDAIETNAAPARFPVSAYVIKGNPLFSAKALASMLSKYTGTNMSLEDIVRAAAAVQAECRRQGFPLMSVAVASQQITNGIVTMNLFQTAVPQIVLSGVRWSISTNGTAIVPNAPPTVAEAAPAPKPSPTPAATNAAPTRVSEPVKPATPEEMARARAALFRKMAELEAQAKDTRIHVVSTNAGPRFDVKRYVVLGNSVLPPAAIGMAISNIDGAFGTNVSFDGVKTVVSELGKAYHERGYQTVTIDVPQQKLTNATVKLQVLEGRLAAIRVKGNRFFSTRNVRRALPSLHTNMVLNVPIFNAELNRANDNQDRQIYPVISPGPVPGASDLTLNVKDRPPLHAKLEINNQSSPGTPDLRVNTSAVYQNLWQAGQSLGLQYGFSPEVYKAGNQWSPYDRPLVAYYSGFYRIPLGRRKSIEKAVANNPGNFGYNEATRQFNLPPSSGRPELTFYANRATIDTGVENLGNTILSSTTTSNGVVTLGEQNFHQDITVNEGLGFQLSKPLREINGIRSILSGGLDFKIYKLTSYGTNVFQEISLITNNNTVYGTTNPVLAQIPTTHSKLNYLPLSLNYSGSFEDSFGPATFGLGLIANLWFSGEYSTSQTGTNGMPLTLTDLHGRPALQSITGSRESTGHWVILRPSFSQDVSFHTNWITSFRADGQWASEPLISVEQFGAGGVNSVRGYHEGEVFGDTGWHVSLEQHTPYYTVGMVHDGTPLTVRGSVYMDYAHVYLIDPQGRQGDTPLWGAGFGFTAAAGSHWQARFLFSWPLVSTPTTTADQPFFNFGLTGQF